MTQKGKKNVKFSRAKGRRKKNKRIIFDNKNWKTKRQQVEEKPILFIQLCTDNRERERGTEGISKEFLDSEKDKVIP